MSTEDTTAPLDNVFFPSVTVCNMNQLRKSFVYNSGITQTNKTEFKRFVEFLTDSQHMSKNESDHWETKLDIIKANLNLTGNDKGEIKFEAENCSDLIMKTSFDGEHDVKIRTNKRHTDFGGCCRLYPSWDESITQTERDLYGASRGIQGSKSGLENGLRLLMDMETFDDAHHSWWAAKLHADHPSLRKSAGLVMALSENLERPLMSQQGNYVAPGTATLLAFKVTVTDTTEAAIPFYTPKQRQCYKSKEFQPKYFSKGGRFRYSESNCLYSAMGTRIEEECNCRPLFMKDSSDLANDKIKDFCSTTQIQCMKNFTTSWGSKKKNLNRALNTVTNKAEECRHNCYRQDLTVTTSEGSYPKDSLAFMQDFCLIVKKIKKICANPDRKLAFEERYKAGTDGAFSCNDFTDDLCARGAEDLPQRVVDAAIAYAKENLAVVRVFLRDPYHELIIRDRRMTKLQFFGSVGGWFGLCCGLSIISVIEMLYHTILLFTALYKKEPVRNDWEEKEEERKSLKESLSLSPGTGAP